MDTKTKGKIVSALRRLTFAYKPINDAEKRQKVDAMLYECEGCSDYVYKGSSEKNFNKLVDKYPDNTVRRVKKIVRDHKEEVVPIEGFKNGWDWNVFIERMFCKSEDIQILCPDCDKLVTDEQKRRRKLVRDTKKTNNA